MTFYNIEIKSKYLDKGILAEEDAITLISEVDNVLYVKNDEIKMKRVVGNQTLFIFFCGWLQK